jgi:hypothetical protein
MLNLFEIEEKVNELAQKIGTPQDILPTFGYSEQNARPHIEVGSWTYAYVVSQSGQEVSRYKTRHIDQLLYKIFADVTLMLSIKYAEQNRIENQDIRKTIFPRQVELLALLSPQWGERGANEQAQLLKQAPFDDEGEVRSDYWISLREQGYSVALANKMANEKYPYPNKPEAGTF